MTALGRLSSLNPISLKAKLIGGGVLVLIVAGLLAFAALRIYNAGIGQANLKIAQYEQQLAQLNANLKNKEIQVRERVITEYHTKQIVRTVVETKNRDIVKTVVPEQFNLSKGWIYAHDQSALGIEIDPKLASNPDPSGITDRVALSAVTENYNKSNRTADKLEALQKYIRDVGIPVTNDPQTINNGAKPGFSFSN